MADAKISDLAAATTPLAGTELAVIVQSGVTKKVAVSDIAGSGEVNIQAAVSDETTALTTGTAKLTFRMPHAMTLTEVRASVTTAPTGSVLTVDDAEITIDIDTIGSTIAGAGLKVTLIGTRV